MILMSSSLLESRHLWKKNTFSVSVSVSMSFSLKSTQYKKLAPNALRFMYKNLKSCKPHEKTKQKHQNARFNDEKLKTKSLMFFVHFFHVVCKISNFNM